MLVWVKMAASPLSLWNLLSNVAFILYVHSSSSAECERSESSAQRDGWKCGWDND